jgi:tetratricopeptide (TPR) repeat protein
MLEAAAQMAAASSAEQPGWAFGKAFWAIFLVVIIAKTLQTLARNDTNRKCVTGLVLVLVSWLITSVVGFVVAEKDLGQVVVAGAAVAGLLILVGLVLSIIGLIEEPRPGVVKGRGQAVWAIVLGILLVGQFSFGFVAAKRKAQQKAFGERTAVVPGETLEFKDMNFRLVLPGKPWVKLDPAKINPLSSVALMRGRPVAFFMLIGERVQAGQLPPEDLLLDVVKGNLRSAYDDVEILEEKPLTVAGMKGTFLRSDAEQGSQSLTLVHWLHCNRGFFYQLVCWSARRDAAQLERNLTGIVAGFSQIDPDLEALPSARIKAYRSDRYGYAVDLSETAWTVWEDRENDAPSADFGAVIGQHAAFMVVPAYLMGLDANLDSVTYALLQRMDIEYPSKGITDLDHVEADGVAGYDFRFTRKSGTSEYVYRMRVRVRGGEALLLSGWVDKGVASALEQVDEAVEAVVIDGESPPAPDEEGFSELEAHRHAMVANDIGIFYYDARDIPKAVEFWRVAARLAPTDKAVVSNYVTGLQETGRHLDALNALDAYIGGFPQNYDLRAIRASLLTELGRTQEAVDTLAQLFEAGYRDDDRFTLYGDLLMKANQVERAINETARYLEKGESIAVVVLLANLHGSAGDHEKAVGILEERMKGIPLNAELAYALADHQGEAGLHREAIKSCDALIGAGYDTAYAHYLRGYSLYALKWYREAKDAFEQALMRSPNDAQIKSFLDAANGMLGQGENRSVRTPIEPVEAPSEFFAVDRPDDDRVKGYRSYYLWRVDAVSYLAGKELRATEYRAFKVLTNAAVSEFGTFQVPFDPLLEDVYVNSLTVKAPDGETVSTGKVDDYYVVDDTSTALATQDKILHVPIRGLEPGHVVEAVVTRRDHGPSERFRFRERGLSAGAPVIRSAVYVCGDVDAVACVASEGVEFRRSDSSLSFVTEYPPVCRTESFLGDWQGYLPHVRLGDSSRTWKGEVKEHLSAIEGVLETSEAAVTLAATVFAGTASSHDKVLAATRHVRDKYSYKGIEFGRRASIPRDVADVIESKYGDCKDLALLLVHLTRSQGLDARLALVNTSGPVTPELADIDQFDHMIAFVPVDGGRFIDCTSKHASSSIHVPLGLGGRRALVLDPSLQNPLVQLPRYPQDADRVRLERVATPVDGDLSVEERVKVTDYYAAYVRSWLAAEDPANRGKVVQEWLTEAHVPIRIERLEVAGLDDPDLPFEMRATYRVPNAVRRTGNQRAVRVPFGWERSYLRAEHSSARLAPLTVKYPLNWLTTTEVRPPADASIEAPAPAASGGVVPCARWSLEYAPAGDGVSIRFESVWRAGEYAVEDFGPFQDMTDRALDSLCAELLLTPAEGP